MAYRHGLRAAEIGLLQRHDVEQPILKESESFPVNVIRTTLVMEIKEPSANTEGFIFQDEAKANMP